MAFAKSDNAPVVNVTYKTINHPDSGLGGLYWSLNELNRHVQIWQTGETSYLIVVSDQGKWNTKEGYKTPGTTLADPTYQGADGSGPAHGGYVATFSYDGAVNTDAYPAFGNLGTFDYNGVFGPSSVNVGGVTSFNYLAAYFPGYSGFAYVDWGWTYTYKSQEWVNSQSGNSGDIVIP